MKNSMLFGSAVLLAALAVQVSGCDSGWGERETPQLETRTFALRHVEPSEAVSLIGPYVYTDRVDAPGMVSEVQRDSVAITVRETADNLNRIAAVLSEFDRPAERTLALKFQLISPNGSQPDPEIVDVITELRRFLRFDGYSLSGESLVSLSDGSFEQSIKTEEMTYSIGGYYFSARNRLDIALHGSGVPLFETRVVIQPGKTLVLGTVTGDETTAILVMRSLVTDQVEADPAEA